MKTETKFTKGPWTHTPFKLKYLSVHADSGDPHQSRGRICQIDDWQESAFGITRIREEIEANARLIAAAPELFEALQGVLEVVEARVRNAELPDWKEKLQAGYAALKKAQGEA